MEVFQTPQSQVQVEVGLQRSDMGKVVGLKEGEHLRASPALAWPQTLPETFILRF